MSAVASPEAVFISKRKDSNQKTTVNQRTVATCTCRGCTDPEFRSGMCWYHYSEERYLSK